MNFFKKIHLTILTWCLQTSDVDVEENQTEQIDFAVGGQAVVEGVMMRGPSYLTVAVRKPDGEIVTRQKEFLGLTQKYPILNIPLVRGVVTYVEMMIVGSEAINFSAEQAYDEEDDKKKKDVNAPKTRTEKLITGIIFLFSLGFSLVISLSIFQALPLKATTLLQETFPAIENYYVLFNIVDSFIKILIFLAYIYGLSLVPSFRRLFQYHGAEHKSIYNFESKKPLTVENAAKQKRLHPRCGTSFILIIFAVGIIVYSFVPKSVDFWTNFGRRILVLPIIAGLSFEALRFSARHQGHWFVKVLTAPGLLFQRLTTREPEGDQLEVALHSLEQSLAFERAK
jgi:uncharacterized protein YqhQ